MIPVHTGLVWGIKRSLLGYLRRIPDGVVSVDGGVSLTHDYRFHFPLVEGWEFDPSTGTGTLLFGGAVYLYGHMGALAVTLKRPQLQLQGGMASLSFTTLATDAPEQPDRLFSIHEAHDHVSEGIRRWQDLEPILTTRGASLFESNYAAGDPFDRLSVRIPAS